MNNTADTFLMALLGMEIVLTDEQKAEAEISNEIAAIQLAKINAEMKAAGDAEAAEKACKCGKCGGTGKLRHYSHVSNGVCFACDGTGKKGMNFTKAFAAMEDSIAD